MQIWGQEGQIGEITGKELKAKKGSKLGVSGN